MEQKKILAIHDLCSMGRAGLTQVIQALGAMGHQCIPLPTAVYSTHAGIPGFEGQDLTEWIARALEQYQALEISFDGVLSGFLSTPQQVCCVLQGAQAKKKDGILVVDPVMGDDGKLYRICTPDLIGHIQTLCENADYITPNQTEAAVLLGYEVDRQPKDLEEATSWVKKLCELYQTKTILTGFKTESTIYTLCGQGNQVEQVENRRIGAYYPGTGDLFSAVLIGGLVQGECMGQAAQRAADFVCECIAQTVCMGYDTKWGVALETQLGRLSQ